MKIGKKIKRMRRYILSVGELYHVSTLDAPRMKRRYCVQIIVNGHNIYAVEYSLKSAYKSCVNAARRTVKMDARNEKEKGNDTNTWYTLKAGEFVEVEQHD